MQRTYQLAGVSGMTLQRVAVAVVAAASYPSGTMSGARTVLVVDDELDVREIVGEVLEDAGYAVQLAADGREGLAQAEGAPRPLVLLLDLVMPVMSGNELFTRLRSEPRTADIPVVVMTSDPTGAPKGVPVLSKPVGIATLLDAVGGAFVPSSASAEE